MSNLTIYKDGNPDTPIFSTSDIAEVAAKLGELGVCFERWETHDNLPENDKAILELYAQDIERLKSMNGYQSVDIVNLSSDHPDTTALRSKFLAEHTHSEDEVRFFVKGAGMFYLHIADEVYMLECARGDLINVPANAKHWFDMGARPEFTCIRLFTSKDGWAAGYTGDDIADKFPKFDKQKEAA